nr:MAG TPA: hypothetical protein [Caudoviricetes sp.]DAO46504.1 MAG TPA: hypothetical protein [Caudoviricetes sp.]DAQ91248.1 MAG TPA: hypothetical protein [Caudoviricetes sp.]DAU94979.1 MAG TPA: hypothetical protein [Caudoviricetes sp.]
MSFALYGQSKHYHWEKQSALSISPHSYRIVSAWFLTILSTKKAPAALICDKDLIHLLL